MDKQLLLAAGIAALAFMTLGSIYRWLLSRGMPNIPDDQFVREFFSHHRVSAPPEAVIAERRRVARVLGIEPEKLGIGQTVEALSDRLSYLAEFSVAWNDLADEAREAREAAGLAMRDRPPANIGQLIEDRLSAQGIS
jgi:hypothetical protein